MASLPMSFNNDRPDTPRAPEDRAAHQEDMNVEASLRDLTQRVAALIDEREAVDEELKRVKRKYRRATTDAQTAKNEVALLRQQLTDAQERLAAIERRSIVAVFKRITFNLVMLLKPRQSSKSRNAEQIELVRRSHLFDAEWYLNTYSDVAEARLDPAVHYVIEGGSESRDPGPEFSSSRYLKANRDVAQTGLNPLVHYLEHGLAEGRSAGSSGSALPRRSVEDFGPAAPVYQSPVAPAEPVRWLRHYQLDPARPRVEIGDQSGGYYTADGVPSVAAALARFWALSGLKSKHPLATEIADPNASGGPAMLDGWFAGQSLFQARWKFDGASSLVIRGFQRGRNGKVRLIGEALVTSSLDIVDFPVAHPFFPILFLACRPDGECAGATNLFFPSLCRGGQNYAELLLEAADGGLSPVGLGDRYAHALQAILIGEAPALLRTVRLDLAGADGTRPMFQCDCQDWLNWVLRIDLGAAIEPARSKRAEIRFLSDRGSGDPGHHRERASAAAQLILPSDSMPTIAALVAAAGDEGVGELATHTMSMIVVHADPAKPALAIAVPPGLAFPTGLPVSAFPLAFPRIIGATTPERHLPAAIRTLAERRLAESELLQPLSQPFPILPASEESRAAVIAIEPALWPLPALEAGLAALALQKSSDLATVCMIGVVDPQRRAMIELAFAGRTSSRVNVHAFVDGLTEADVLHLGPSVILHDSRTLQTFQSLLTQAASASCPLLTCTKQGKNWVVGVADAGKALHRVGESGPLALARHAEMLWRSTFPIQSQPRNLWAARPALLRNAPEEAADSHLCCAWVTASYWDGEPEQQATLCLPAARADLSLRVEELVG